VYAAVLRDPNIVLKFLSPSYANCLSTADRAAILANHYEHLQYSFNQYFLAKIIHSEASLWSASVKECELEIRLGIMHSMRCDGELSLYLRADGMDVYMLSFVFVPGRLMKVDEVQAICVTELAGKKGFADRIGIATRSTGGVAPPLVLMAAVQGIALALDIRHIFAVSVSQQISYEGESLSDNFASAYDDFWISIEGERLSSGWFAFPVPLPEKPLALIKQNHRPRVKSRRAFRTEITNSVREHVEKARDDSRNVR
jgi:uncharacterized protein VirK/YbjX